MDRTDPETALFATLADSAAQLETQLEGADFRFKSLQHDEAADLLARVTVGDLDSIRELERVPGLPTGLVDALRESRGTEAQLITTVGLIVEPAQPV